MIKENFISELQSNVQTNIKVLIYIILRRVDCKVLKIIRSDTSTRKNLIFDYDAMGHRIAKHVLSSTDELEHSTYYILDAQGNVVSTYEREVDAMEESVAFYQAEKHLYGNSRLGILQDSIELLGTINDTYTMDTTNHRIGQVNYELSNHLGNVLSVISDKPIPVDNSGSVDYWISDIRQSTDYSPFGVTLSGRNFTLNGAEKSRYGYQGSEMDNEIKGEGNSYSTFNRMLDPRLGRWFSLDPVIQPWQSPYTSMDNSPISVNDVMGANGEIGISKDGTTIELNTTIYLYRSDESVDCDAMAAFEEELRKELTTVAQDQTFNVSTNRTVGNKQQMKVKCNVRIIEVSSLEEGKLLSENGTKGNVFMYTTNSDQYPGSYVVRSGDEAGWVGVFSSASGGTGNNYAHEYLHLFGLEDRYTYGAYIKGGEIVGDPFTMPVDANEGEYHTEKEPNIMVSPMRNDGLYLSEGQAQFLYTHRGTIIPKTHGYDIENKFADVVFLNVVASEKQILHFQFHVFSDNQMNTYPYYGDSSNKRGREIYKTLDAYSQGLLDSFKD